MLRNEVEKMTGLRRKAIEYYEEKGLIRPEKTESGYRQYSAEDVERLQTIAAYRKLGLTLTELAEVLDAKPGALSSLLRDKQYRLSQESGKVEILEKLCAGVPLETLQDELARLEQQEDIYSRLERVFPGYFGQCFFAAYKPFLQEPIAAGGEQAYQDYITYLDALPPLQLTAKEQDYIEEISRQIDMDALDKIQTDKIQSLLNIERWIQENAHIVEQYRAYMASEDYLSSPLAQIRRKLQRYMLDNAYYQTAVPLLRSFSKSYDAYYQSLLRAETVLQDAT